MFAYILGHFVRCRTVCVGNPIFWLHVLIATAISLSDAEVNDAGTGAGVYGQISLPKDFLQTLPALAQNYNTAQGLNATSSHANDLNNDLPKRLTEEAVNSNQVQGLIGDLSAALVRSFTNLLLSNAPITSAGSRNNYSPSQSIGNNNNANDYTPFQHTDGNSRNTIDMSRPRKARQYNYYEPSYQQQQNSPPYYYNSPQYQAPFSSYNGGPPTPPYYNYGGPQHYGGGGYPSPPYNSYGQQQQPYYYGASSPYIMNPFQQQRSGNNFYNNFGQPQPQPYMPPAGSIAGPVRHAQNQFGYGVNAGVYAGTFGGSSAISSPDGPNEAGGSHVGNSFGGLSGWPLDGFAGGTANAGIRPQFPSNPSQRSTTRPPSANNSTSTDRSNNNNNNGGSGNNNSNNDRTNRNDEDGQVTVLSPPEEQPQ